MAFYAVDPVSGNSLGFQPSLLLHPRDAFDVRVSPMISLSLFLGALSDVGNVNTRSPACLPVCQMFDTDHSGEVDEDEFAMLLEYMGIELSEEEMEKMFKRFDTDGSGTISCTDSTLGLPVPIAPSSRHAACRRDTQPGLHPLLSLCP
jgi:Ca2+-binding EF-hand superfamily protein